MADLARDGVLFTPGIRVILEETANLSPPAQSAVIARACERVRARRTEGRRPWTPGELRVAVKRMVLRLAADELADARAKARRRRRVSVTPDVDGMAWLSALISDVDAHRIHHRLSAAAAADTADAKTGAAEAKASGAAADTDGPGGVDDRCMDERRADLLVETLLNCRSRNTVNHDPDGSVEAHPGGDAHGTGRDPATPHSEAEPVPGGADAGNQPDTSRGRRSMRGDEPPGRFSQPADLTEVGGHGQGQLSGLRADDSGWHEGVASESGSDALGSGEPPGSSCGPGGSTGPVPRGQRPEIHVVIDVHTLLGLADDPAHVHGMGPIPPDVARELSADGRWRLLVTDPALGQVTGTSARTYTPSAGLARLIRAREPVCRMPGCARQAVNCDLDHTLPWPQPPGTTESNLGPLCRRCHNLKTHHGFHLHNREENDSHGTDPPTTSQSGSELPAADLPGTNLAGTDLAGTGRAGADSRDTHSGDQPDAEPVARQPGVFDQPNHDDQGTDLPNAGPSVDGSAASTPTDACGCRPDAADTTRPSTGWTWTFPSGLTHTDHPDPPLPDD